MDLERANFRHLERLRVRWAEVDLQRIVFNGHYLMYLDTAVAGWWRAMALPYEATLQHFDGDLFVRKATLEYHASARFDETLEIGVRCERIGNSSILLRGAVFRQERLLVSGELVYVFADATAQTPKPVPAGLRALLQGFEAGEAMLEPRVGAWAELSSASSAIRQEVFPGEQGIAAELIADDADACAVHAVAFNRLGMPVSTGRLVATGPGTSKIGRMASRATLRGAGAGRAVLDALLFAARARGDREVLLHAQSAAAGFYARQGFMARGASFVEAGLPHVAMARALDTS
jgi:YbgC/YbaW family acyl-CoA thioester hydrolase